MSWSMIYLCNVFFHHNPSGMNVICAVSRASQCVSFSTSAVVVELSIVYNVARELEVALNDRQQYGRRFRT